MASRRDNKAASLLRGRLLSMASRRDNTAASLLRGRLLSMSSAAARRMVLISGFYLLWFHLSTSHGTNSLYPSGLTGAYDLFSVRGMVA